jgi:hypothetical protein
VFCQNQDEGVGEDKVYGHLFTDEGGGWLVELTTNMASYISAVLELNFDLRMVDVQKK